jgi:hypothetical protein
VNKYQQIIVAACVATLPLTINAKQLPPIKFEGMNASVFEEGYKEGILNFLPIPTSRNGEPDLTVHMHGNNGTDRGSDADKEMAFEDDAGGWSAAHVDGKRFSLVSLFVDIARFEPKDPNGQKRPFVFDAIRDGSKVATTVVPLGMKGVVTFPSGFSDIDKFEVYVEGMRAQYPDIAIIQNFLIAVDDIVVDDLEGSDTDTDKDGLTDTKEAELGTDPNKPDTDGDALKDGEEANQHQTDPLKPDTDGDGFNDKAEIDAGTDPLLATSKPPEPVDKDTDKDSLTDTQEAELGTDPTKADTDSDGLNDGDEVNTHQTDPLKPDTDGDGSNDKAEIDAGTNPLLATSIPAPAPPTNGNIFPKEGMWWNPQRSGHGVDIEYDGTNIAIAWYTYNDDGTPTWYLAAGPFSGNNWTGNLDTYIWDGTKAVATPVGTATFEFTDQTHAKFSWVIDGVAGNEPFEYFVTSDQPTTLDTTGLWFESAKPGYGLTISTQGTTEFGILYFYDDQGQPRWALGVKKDSDTYALDQFSGGFCPVCDLTVPETKPAGTITRTFTDKSKGVLSTDIQLTTPLAGNWKIDNAQIINLSNP